jgi:drug/metabolite transporter (DMT)-like permease
MDLELRRTLQSDLFLLITAAIWGTAFVAQRAGMEYVGPFTFNAVRFFLGGMSLLPLWLLTRRRQYRASGRNMPGGPASASSGRKRWPLAAAGSAAGLLLFLGSSFQQVGIVYTTAGNAGFITGLYVIIVPLLGLAAGRRPGGGVWAGAVLAVAGLYFINGTAGMRLAGGDALVLVCAFFFAAHVLLIGRISPGLPALPLSIIQFLTCSLLSLLTALAAEEIRAENIAAAAVPILYGGIGSVGIAYTLQVVAQKHARPGHAAIILSLESVFALLGGWILLAEAVGPLKLLGCSLMLAGMLSAQLQRYYLFRRAREARRTS